MAQEVKNDIKKALQVNTIPLIAIMTAVTTVLTMLVKIPTPIRGYLNLSDTMIYFSAYAFGPWVGGIIGGLGPALSDLISGYPQWAIFTFVIDGLQAVLVGLLVKKFNPANIIIGSVIAGVWKVFGYFIAGGILSGFGPALGEIAGNSFQMAVGLIVGFALFTAVRQASRQAGRYTFAVSGHADQVEHDVDLLVDDAWGYSAVFQRESDLILDTRAEQLRFRILLHVADALRQCRDGVPARIHAINFHDTTHGAVGQVRNDAGQCHA